MAVSATSSATIAERLSRAIAARTTRRGFLSRTAITATALAAAPTTFALRPVSAYAAVCGCSGSACDCGSACCDGYTEFCCTLTGVNACPSGTALGGWWKADGASMCGGGPRFYMDCNVKPGQQPCSCGCAGGDCNNRKSCCTQFRYGQCHQEIAAMGPIMCRVVSCTPPWVLDPTCSTVVATDQNTLFHDRPCLETPVGSLDSVVRVDPTHVRVIGWAADSETNAPINVQLFVDGGYVTTVLANKSRSDVAAAYPTFGPNHGFDVTIPIYLGSGSVCAYALDSTQPAYNPSIGCRPIGHLPFGYLDVMTWAAPGQLRLAGWAIDPDVPAPIDVHAWGGSTFLGATTANDSRPDVAKVYPGYGDAHGFDFTVPAPADDTTVCAFGINVGPATGNPAIGCAPMSHMPFGHVDAVSRVTSSSVRVQGWAIDPDTTDSIDVHVWSDGQFVAAIPANGLRVDVGLAYPGYGAAHGFDAVVPIPVGRRSVCVFGINAGPGRGNPAIACLGLS